MERGGRVDLLLTDATMPVLGGHELAARAAARWPEVPIVLMSGYSERLAADAGTSAPYAATLQKPFTTEALWEAVERALGAAKG